MGLLIALLVVAVVAVLAVLLGKEKYEAPRECCADECSGQKERTSC